MVWRLPLLVEVIPISFAVFCFFDIVGLFEHRSLFDFSSLFTKGVAQWFPLFGLFRDDRV